MLKKVNKNGCVHIPLRFRRNLGIKIKDEVEVGLNANKIIIGRADFHCVFCQTTENLVRIGSVAACRHCIERLHNAKDGEMLYPSGIFK